MASTSSKPLTAQRKEDRMTKCVCVSKHVPLPLKYVDIQVDQEAIHLCPTTHHNLLTLLAHYDRLGHRPPGSTRKHYSDYVQGLAERMTSGTT